MNTSIRALTTAAALAAVFGIAAPARAQAQDPSAYGDGYQSGNYGRIRSAEAGATIVRADGQTDGRDRSGVNAPIFPGDVVRTDGSQFVEVQLANGTIVRIDRSSDLAFQSLPNPSAKFQDNSVLTLSAGAVRIASNLGDKEEFRIDTRDASVYLLGNGEFRIDAGARGGTVVSSQRGVAEVVGSDSSVLVRGGTRSSVVAGSAPANPSPYSTFASDGFDRWSAARDEAYRTSDQYASGNGLDQGDVPAEVRPYYGELSASGTWVETPEYGTVWTPSGIPAGWQPYSNGYWSYGPGGYFWVSYEPWGWAPYHYGNWQWMGGYGWGWIPGNMFAGAWVSWSWGSLYVGWAPLDYWGRPGWAGGPYYYGYYDPGCWTFVDYNNIGSTNVPRYAVPVGRVGDDLRHATVVARPPRVDPRHVADGSGARERARRDVANDHAAHMRPIAARGKPTQTLSDVQTQLKKRPARATATPRLGNALGGDPAGSVNAPARTRTGISRESRPSTGAAGSLSSREAPTVRERRILEDPRQLNRKPSQRSTDGVRDLYQRMSRPRETREQAAAPSQPQRSQPRAQTSRAQTPQAQAPRAQAPRPQAPRAQTPRAQTPQAQAPRAQAPRAQAPRAQTPRAQTPRAQTPQAQAPRAQAPRAQAPQRANPQSAPRQPARPSAPQGQSRHADKKR